VLQLVIADERGGENDEKKLLHTDSKKDSNAACAFGRYQTYE